MPPPPRSPFLDNAKGLFIAAVVWYHSLVVFYSPTLPPSIPGLETIFLLLVMPAFSLLSGFLSSPDLTVKRQNNLLTTGAAFVVFQLLNWILGILNGIGIDSYLPSNTSNTSNSNNGTAAAAVIPFPIPVFFPTVMGQVPDTKALPVTWFLLALLFWRALTPMISRLRHPIFTSLVISMLGLSVDLGFGSQNIVSFLPFYVMGVSARHTKQGQLLWNNWILLSSSDAPAPLEVTSMKVVTRVSSRQCLNADLAVTLSLFVLPLLTCMSLSAMFPVWWSSTSGIGYYVSHGYSCLYGIVGPTEPLCTSLFAWCTRALFYLLSVPIIIGCLRLVPDKKLWIVTRAGVNSVAIYLFHPLLLFNIITLVLVSRSLDLITSGQGAIHHNGAPPYQGMLSFVLITILSLIVFYILSVDCWHCCCWVCLRPPVVRGLMLRADEVEERRVRTRIRSESINNTNRSMTGPLEEQLL